MPLWNKLYNPKDVHVCELDYCLVLEQSETNKFI